MRASRFSRYKILPRVSPCTQSVIKKKVQRNLYSPCPKAHRESSRVVRTWAPQPYKDVHKEPLSTHQTSPCLILSYVICRPRSSSAPVSCIPTKSIRPSARSLVHSRAVLRVAQIPLSLVATVLLQSSPYIHTLKKKYRFGRIERYV